MEKLIKKFKKNGFLFNQIEREKDIAVYEKFLIDGDNLDSVGFEVIVIRKQKETQWGDIHYEARELYPSNEHWGSYGWTFIDLRDAMNKFNILLGRGRSSTRTFGKPNQNSIVHDNEGGKNVRGNRKTGNKRTVKRKKN